MGKQFRDFTHNLRVEAWSSNLGVDLTPQLSIHKLHNGVIYGPSTDDICALLETFLGSPPAAILDAVQSGLVERARFKHGNGPVFYREPRGLIYCQQKKSSVTNPVHKWKLDLRKSSGKPTKEDKGILYSYCLHVMQSIRPRSTVQIEFPVWKDQKTPGEEWVYCSSSKALVAISPIRNGSKQALKELHTARFAGLPEFPYVLGCKTKCQTRSAAQETDFCPNSGVGAVIAMPVATNTSQGHNYGTYRIQMHRNCPTACRKLEWLYGLVAAIFNIRLCSTDTANISK
jgi:hypothetical protein